MQGNSKILLEIKLIKQLDTTQISLQECEQTQVQKRWRNFARDAVKTQVPAPTGSIQRTKS